MAGFLGAITGLGGGVVIVPLLTLLLGVDIRYAIGASLVSVIATSSGAPGRSPLFAHRAHRPALVIFWSNERVYLKIQMLRPVQIDFS
jgi:uncharacterized membrane protein YfcA